MIIASIKLAALVPIGRKFYWMTSAGSVCPPTFLARPALQYVGLGGGRLLEVSPLQEGNLDLDRAVVRIKEDPRKMVMEVGWWQGHPTAVQWTRYVGCTFPGCVEEVLTALRAISPESVCAEWPPED